MAHGTCDAGSGGAAQDRAQEAPPESPLFEEKRDIPDPHKPNIRTTAKELP